MEQIKFKDIIAICIIVACFILIALKIDTVVGAILIAVTTHYFSEKSAQ